MNLGTEPNDWVRDCTLRYLTNQDKRIDLGIREVPDLVTVEIASGIGRNGVWLAGLDFNVTVFAGAAEALKHSTELARRQKVHINTRMGDFRKAARLEDAWAGLANVIVAAYHPVPLDEREIFFRALDNIAAPGGVTIGEWLHPDQALGHGPAGLRVDPGLFFTPRELRSAYPGWTILVCQRVERDVDEGDLRIRRAVTTQFLAQKPHA